MPWLLLIWVFLWATAVGALNVTESDDAVTVDTGSRPSFVVSIAKTDGTITSIVYDGAQYVTAEQKSNIASGLNTATVSYETIGDVVVVSVVADDDDFDLTNYFIKDGDSIIYQGTYTVSEPSIGELRFLYRLYNLTGSWPEGTVSDTLSSGTVMEKDSSNRATEDQRYCAYSDEVYACMVVPLVQSREKGSGGPFHRDIDLNYGGTYNALSYYMNSGHVQMDPFYRYRFHGPYLLHFGSSVPKVDSLNVSFYANLGLKGYLNSTGRGVLTGRTTGVEEGFAAVIGLNNTDHQFWATAGDNGTFTAKHIPAGTYTMTLYQEEFVAATATVSIPSAGATTTKDIQATSTPFEFLNGDKFLRMRPSDTRMSDWNPGTFVVGKHEVGDFPMCLWKEINSPAAIQFSLDKALNSTATIRVATTIYYAGGRPEITVNDDDCGTPDSPNSIDTRSVTHGAYRGYGEVYECLIPAGNLLAGLNNVSIAVASGHTGDDYLSPFFILDAIELFY
ncbi:hypothetical protein ASPBRDRAFT_191161 [Aspergillus brasiliensis CBS 101740]|uniref:rhamnogalacturonan endolyase n=1 Tax=Aspergillus brasiliensis (strain CBS 101740 / IMI 381727 / IBT 21946) TaxID=767769 RepID=A0A1L9V1Q6_ASPBC|nr:hypothetical protein ASPBRDRAFT_191161 [Aspergillus brasiliensis CBS 101740]